MKISTAKSTIALTVMTLVCGASVAEGPLRAKNYECQELRTLVANNEGLELKGFLGSRSWVFPTESSCDIVNEVPARSTWRTKDKFACLVGYRCDSLIDLERLGFSVGSR